MLLAEMSWGFRDTDGVRLKSSEWGGSRGWLHLVDEEGGKEAGGRLKKTESEYIGRR